LDTVDDSGASWTLLPPTMGYPRNWVDSDSRVGISLTGGLHTRVIMACLPVLETPPLHFCRTARWVRASARDSRRSTDWSIGFCASLRTSCPIALATSIELCSLPKELPGLFGTRDFRNQRDPHARHCRSTPRAWPWLGIVKGMIALLPCRKVDV
jgi:hypothetical protein